MDIEKNDNDQLILVLNNGKLEERIKIPNLNNL